MTEPTDPKTVDLEAVFTGLRAEIEATEIGLASELNFSVDVGADAIVARFSQLRSFRDEIEKEFRRFDFRNIDRLGDYALAAKYLYNLESVAAPAEPTGDSPELARGREIRGKLTSCVQVLVTWGSLDAAQLRAIEQLPRGYRGTSNALQRLLGLISNNEALFRKEVPSALTLIAEAMPLSVALGAMSGDSPSVGNDYTVLRQKATRLMFDAYNEVRAALGWVRRAQKDADEIAPSMAQIRSMDAKRSDPVTDRSPTPAGPVGPVEPVIRSRAHSATSVDSDTPLLPDGPFDRKG